MVCLMSKGSEWRKWDLHVHTPESYHNEFTFSDEIEKTNYQNKIWDKYIDKLEEISFIRVVLIANADDIAETAGGICHEIRNIRGKDLLVRQPDIDAVIGPDNRREDADVLDRAGGLADTDGITDFYRPFNDEK